MRKYDSGWRDSRLPVVHSGWGFDVPVSGMTFPTIEYDRGEALAVINYIRRDVASLPKGHDVGRAYAALSHLRGPIGTVLPFFTVQYDPRNWAMQLFAHNDPALDLLGTPRWQQASEQDFAWLLYRIRGRRLPDYVNDRVQFSTAPWLRLDGPLPTLGWPGQDMSVRRREYEPEGPGVGFNDRNPCADIDFAVVGDKSGEVSLLVDYKLLSAYVDPKHKTYLAMSGLLDNSGQQIPAMITRYDPIDALVGRRWTFETMPLNASAQALLASVTGRPVNDGWNALALDGWTDVLNAARDR